MFAVLYRHPFIFILIGLLGAVAADWPDTETAGSFVCRADFPLREVEPLINELSQLQSDLVHALGVAPARETIQVYLFHDRQAYERYLKQYFPSVPFRRAVYIKDKGQGRVFAFRSPQFDIDLRHECTHALLHASLKNIPLWLDEGLAGYFELPAAQRAFGNPHLNSIRWNVLLGIVPSIENLENCTDISKMGKAEYCNSWAWVCFMLNGPPEARDELINYLHELQNEYGTKGDSPIFADHAFGTVPAKIGTVPESPPDLLSNRLKHRLPDLHQSFIMFFKTWKSK
jgi:hypothetical protein